MALTKFNESVTNHQNNPDKPGLSSDQLKALFDKAAVDIKSYINNTLTSELDTKITQLTNKVNSIYPVGSIYMSVNSTNPSTLFGGTWIAWGAGKVPVGININETEFNESEKTGGTKTHILTVQEMPSHGHSVSIANSGSCTTNITGAHNHDVYVSLNGLAGGNARRIGTAEDNSGIRSSSIISGGSHSHTVPDHTHTVNQNNAGGGQAHNNLQPYITCYMWKRTA